MTLQPTKCYVAREPLRVPPSPRHSHRRRHALHQQLIDRTRWLTSIEMPRPVMLMKDDIKKRHISFMHKCRVGQADKKRAPQCQRPSVIEEEESIVKYIFDVSSRWNFSYVCRDFLSYIHKKHKRKRDEGWRELSVLFVVYI